MFGKIEGTLYWINIFIGANKKCTNGGLKQIECKKCYCYSLLDWKSVVQYNFCFSFVDRDIWQIKEGESGVLVAIFMILVG